MKKIIPVFIIFLFIFPSASSKIIFGIDENYPPHEFVDNGVAKGFNVDIIRAIAKDMNESVEIRPMVWDEAMEALKNGSIDALCMAENEERRQYFDFSRPILTIKLAIFVRKEITGIDDIYALENHSVAVERGDIAEEYLLSHNINAYILEADSQEEAMKLLVNGEALAFFGNYYTGVYIIQKYGYSHIKVIGEEVEIGNRVIAVAKGNDELLDRINQSILSIREKGIYDRIYKKWYGVSLYGRERYEFPRWLLNAILIITSFIAFVIAAIVVWNRRLQEKVEERTKELREYQKNLEEMVEKRTEEVKFLSHRLAHDLKAPLRSIKTFASLFMSEYGNNIPEEGRDMIRRIENASKRMERMMEKLMDYGKMEERYIRKKRINMKSLLSEILEEMRDEIMKRNAEIVIESLPSVYGDREILKEVMQNLISNAIKFVPSERKPKVRIYGRKLDGRARIYVEDNGIGIPKAKQKEIFDLFTRLHGREEYEGTGIGLAIVKKGVEKMNGRVGVKSEEKKGSTFWIELPSH